MPAGDAVTGQRLRAGAATLLIHAGLIALLLQTGIVPLRPGDQPALAVFEVTPPPPPPPLPAAPQPPVEQRLQPKPVAHPNAAGGRVAARSPERRPIDAPAIPSAMPLPADPLPALALTSATNNAAATAASEGGKGGTGQGSGMGAGNGDAVQGGAPQRFQRADWIAYPTDAVINRYWPAEAVKRRLGGEVVLACAISRPGHPDRCIAIYEAPRGIGFADAALRLSRTFRIRPNRINDRDAPDLPVLIPVTFKASR